MCIMYIGYDSSTNHLRIEEPELINFDANPMKNKHHKIVLTPIKTELHITMMGSNCICARFFKSSTPPKAR